MVIDLMNSKTKFIGVASGIAAEDQGCGDGPVAILEQIKLIYGAKNIDASIVQNTQNFENKLQIVQVINKHLSLLTYAAIKQSHFPIIIGGDHSCAIGSWSGIASAYDDSKEVGLIWIDAHLDSHTFETSQSKNIHGMPVAALLGKGDYKLTNIMTSQPKIKPRNICIIGVRSYEEGEHKLLQELGVKLFYMPEVSERGFAEVFREARSLVLRDTIAYGLSIDLDAIDPLDAPGVGSPVANGIRAKALLETLSMALPDECLIGLEIAEYNPHRDLNYTTRDIAVELISLMLKNYSDETKVDCYECSI